MRKEIFKEIASRLQLVTDDHGKPRIKHIDLWNRQAEFIEQESHFPMPAVFIEFGKIPWRHRTDGMQDAEGTLALHVLTSMDEPASFGCGFDGALDYLDLLDLINTVMNGYSCDYFSSLARSESIPCHDHEEILDSTEVFKTTFYDPSACKKYRKLVRPGKIDIKPQNNES